MIGRAFFTITLRFASVVFLAVLLGAAPRAMGGDADPSRAPARSSIPPRRDITVEERLKALEEVNANLVEENRKLHSELGAMGQQYGKVIQQLQVLSTRLDTSLVRTRQVPPAQPPRSDRSSEGGAGARDNPAVPPDGGATGSPGGGPMSDTGGVLQPPRSSRSDEGGAGARDNPAEPSRTTPFTGPGKIPMRVNFGPGIEFETLNEEYLFQIHNQTQIEGRFYQQPNQNPGAGGFDVPRERFIIAGRLSKPIEYDASLESAYGTVNLLNAFLNWHYDDRLMVKFGRYKVPYLYEYYAVSNTDLLQPERSLFGANFGLNRGVGAQLWGQLFKKSVDYAVGIFDGPRNQQLDFNSAKDVIAYLNYRPFQEVKELEALKYFNVGGSFDFGSQNNQIYPTALRTSVSGTNNPGAFNASPSFLQWNNNVIERGDRVMWSLFTAYYYKSLSLIAEWQGAYAGYSLANRQAPLSTTVPLGGFYVAGGYFLTGETVNRRSQVRPNKPFDLRRKSFGLGAFELEARYSLLTIGDQVFTAGLVDPNLWTDRVQAIDLGLNWYMNEYVKIYLDWQHSEFGSPALFAPGKFQKTGDLFWIRGQVYF
jgi:phosphate-selective porin OprO/OprP